MPLLSILILTIRRATKGAHTPNPQVPIAHAWHTCDLHSILVPRATRFKTTWPRNDRLWGQECLHSISFFSACVTLVQRTKVMPSTIQPRPRPRVLFCRHHIGKGEDPGDEVDHHTKDEWNAQDAIWLRLFVPSITRYLATGAFWVKLTEKHSVGARAFWFSIRSLNLLCTPKSFVIRSIRHNQSLLIKASSSETITIKVLEKKVNFMHLSENSRENRSFLLEKLAIVCIGMPQWWNTLRVNCHYTSMRNILSRLLVLKFTVNCFFFVLNFFVNKLYSS